MTRGGREFITPLTLQALSGHPVHLDLLDPAAEAAMGHIELGWADLVLIALPPPTSWRAWLRPRRRSADHPGAGHRRPVAWRRR